MSDRPEWMNVPQGEPGSARLTLRGQIEREFCSVHLGGPCELSSNMTGTAIDVMSRWLIERAADAPESMWASILRDLAKEVRR